MQPYWAKVWAVLCCAATVGGWVRTRCRLLVAQELVPGVDEKLGARLHEKVHDEAMNARTAPAAT